MDIKEQLKSMKFFFIIVALIPILSGIGWIIEKTPSLQWILEGDGVEMVETGSVADPDDMVDGSMEYRTGNERGLVFVGEKAVPLTKLSEEGMHVQEKDGCVACHRK